MSLKEIINDIIENYLDFVDDLDHDEVEEWIKNFYGVKDRVARRIGDLIS